MLTDWAHLWRELVEGHEAERRKSANGQDIEGDFWQDKAAEYDATLKRRWAEADPLKGLIASRISPDTTVLDIGAGTGRWAISLARRARRVTAVEPSPAMRKVLAQNLVDEGIDNVDIVQGWWPDVDVGPHDISLCSHAMYGCPDLPAFVTRMDEVARHECFLAIKALAPEGLMAEACTHVWGHPHDAPHFVVAYNVLLEIGLCPNVLVDPTPWEPWTSPTLEDALVKMKRRLRVSDTTEHDEHLLGLLQRDLTLRCDMFHWPKAVRSVLVYWSAAG